MNADGSNASTIYAWAGGGMRRPAWSPDGHSIVFETPGFDLWLIDVTLVNGVPTGTNVRVLLQDTTTLLVGPAWSPLGNQIAFSRWTSDGSAYTLEVIPSTGGTPVVVYTAPPGYVNDYPAWSRDASQIAFVENDPAGGKGIRSVNVATLAVTTLLSAQQSGGNDGIHLLDWGRTRDVLTFQMYVGNDIGIYKFEIGGALTRVTGGRAPTWSPDDTAILFVDSGKLSKVEIATGGITRLRVSGDTPDWRRF